MFYSYGWVFFSADQDDGFGNLLPVKYRARMDRERFFWLPDYRAEVL